MSLSFQTCYVYLATNRQFSSRLLYLVSLAAEFLLTFQCLEVHCMKMRLLKTVLNMHLLAKA